MSTTVGSWSTESVIDDEVVDAAEAPGAHSAVGTIDTSAAFGAFLFLSVAREDATALTAAVRINVRRTDGVRSHQNAPWSRVGNLTTAVATTVDATSAAAQNVLNVTTTTNFAVGDFIAIGDMATPARLEFARISKITNPGASGELVLDSVLEVEHTVGQADSVTSQADLWTIWLPGGGTYKVEADYGNGASGSDVVVRARADVWNNVTTT